MGFCAEQSPRKRGALCGGGGRLCYSSQITGGVPPSQESRQRRRRPERCGRFPRAGHLRGSLKARQLSSARGTLRSTHKEILRKVCQRNTYKPGSREPDRITGARLIQ
jgi:hypothetical protein